MWSNWVRHRFHTRKRYGGDHRSEAREEQMRPVYLRRMHEAEMREVMHSGIDGLVTEKVTVAPYTGPRSVLIRTVVAQAKKPAVQVVHVTKPELPKEPRRTMAVKPLEGITDPWPRRRVRNLVHAIDRIALEDRVTTC